MSNDVVIKRGPGSTGKRWELQGGGEEPCQRWKQGGALRPLRTEELYLCDLNARSYFSLRQFLLLFTEATNGSHGLVVLLSLGDKVYQGLVRDLLTRDGDKPEPSGERGCLWEPGRGSRCLKI